MTSAASGSQDLMSPDLGGDDDDDDYLVIDKQLRKHEDKPKRINTYRKQTAVGNQSLAFNHGHIYEWLNGGER